METNSARKTTPLGGIAECGMSDYYKKLDSIAKTRYLEKLKLLGLDEKDDPYDPINSHNFVDDMTRWPAVENGNIFCYYIQRPGVLQSSNCYSRCFQLFSEWIWPLYYLQTLHCDGIYVNPSQNAPA